MDQQRSLFIFVTAAGSARRAGELIRGALDIGWTTYVVDTPNLAQIAPAATLLDLAGAHWIRDYGQPPLDTFPFGTMLVASRPVFHLPFRTMKEVTDTRDILATFQLTPRKQPTA